MMRKILYLIIFFAAIQVKSQELNCLVIINSDQIQNVNSQLTENLQTAISEYINNRKWTNKEYKPQERINCAITLNLIEQTSSTEFKGSIEVLASRPVYNSTYQSPIFIYKDNDMSFSFNEFQNLQLAKNNLLLPVFYN